MTLVVEERMKIVEGRVGQIEDDLDRLTRSMVGDGTAVAPGVIGVLDHQGAIISAHATRLAEMEMFQAKVRWTVGVAASLGSLVGGGGVYLVSQLLSGGLS